MTSKTNELLYVIPDPMFFDEGYRGRVMHALGICEGFIENNWSVTMIGGPGILNFKADVASEVTLIEVGYQSNSVPALVWYRDLWVATTENMRRTAMKVLMIRYVISTFLGVFLLARKSRHKGIFTILEVNSFAYHIFKGGGILSRFIASVERKVADAFELVYVVSQTMADDARISSITPPLIAVVNGASSRRVRFNNEGTVPSSKRLVYFGTLMGYWDFEFLINAINKLHLELEVELVVLGDGPERGALQKGISRKDLVSFKGSFARQDLGAFIDSRSDILLLPPKTKADLLLTGGMSTKIFDYLSMELPILAPRQPEIATNFKNEDHMLMYEDSVDDFVAQYRRLAFDTELRHKLGSAARRLFESSYSWRSRMSIIISAIERLKV